MITSEPDRLLRTIQSRAQIVRLNPVPIDQLAARLFQIAEKEQAPLTEEHATIIAEASLGHPRDAIKLLDQILASADEEGKVTTKALDGVIEQVIASSPQEVLQKFVEAIVDGNVKRAFGAARKIQGEHERFLWSVVDMLRQLVYFCVDPTLATGYYLPRLKKLRQCDLAVAVLLLKVFGNAYQEAKSYRLPADVLLDIAIAQSGDEEASHNEKS